jgi:hypothetical protein
MGYVTEDNKYCINHHPVIFRRRDTGEPRIFWPDTGCSLLLASFAAIKGEPDHPMARIRKAVLCPIDIVEGWLARCINSAITYHFSPLAEPPIEDCNQSRLRTTPQQSEFADTDDTENICDSISLEALIVKKMVLDNPDTDFLELIKNEDIAFAIYRFLDHMEEKTDSVTAINLVGMMKSDIDELWNIKLETENSKRLWDIEDALPSVNANSTPCPLGRVFEPGFYAIERSRSVL